MPMVCEGKEKENLLIELAGRSGFITVATNMAGRGANIKPDLVKVGQIAQDAYDAASGNKGVVVDLDKDSQATKIFRGLQAHIPVAVAESPDQKPAPGQVLIRSKQSLKEGESFAPAGKDQVQLKGDDYETGGLYVIGTERSSSRRIDDQLIGRAGRQGAVGDSRFFLSLQDDLLRLAQSHRLEDVEKAMGEGRSGVTSSQVSEAVDEVQNLAESQRIDARENSDKFDETMKLQRKTYFKFREQMVTGTDEDGERVDPKDYMADFAATGLADELKQRLGDKRKYSPEEIRQATARLGQELGLPLKLEPKKDVKRRDLVDELYPQVSELIETSPLPEKDWKVAFLYTADQGWQDQLIVMNELRDGVQLEAMAGKKPEEVYVHRGFEVFQGMVDQLKRKLGTHVLPLMVRRGQEQPPQRPAI